MGFYLRKSISAGPFRFNLSGSGVGMSVGVKGFRVGTGPRGNYVHMGRGGLYYRASLGGGSHGRSAVSPGRASEPVVPIPAVPGGFAVVETGNVLEMEPSNGSHIVEQINEKLALLRLWPWSLLLGLIASGLLLWHPGLEIPGALAVTLTVVAAVVAFRLDQSRRTVVIMYDLSEDAAARFEALTDEFDKFASASRIWNVDTAGRTADWKRNAGASQLITRQSGSLNYAVPSGIKTNVGIPCIAGGQHSVYFLPDVALVMEGNRAGALSYEQLKVSWDTTVFIETGGVPSDAQVVGQTWRFVNKNGGPDRRFNNNRQIPKVLYQEIELRGPGGLHKLLQLSKVTDHVGFDAALTDLNGLLNSLQNEARAHLHSVETFPASGGAPSLSARFDGNRPTLAIIAGTLATVATLGGVLGPSEYATLSERLQPTQAAAVVEAAPAIPVTPSFDCAGVDSEALKLICTTPGLATADKELSTAYGNALSRVSWKRKLEASEWRWAARRNRLGTSVASLQKMYEQRIAYLSTLAPDSRSTGGSSP